MEKFKDYVKNKTGAAATDSEIKKLTKDYLQDISGATVPAAERRRLEESIPKQKKGGMTKKQLDIAEAVAENPLFPVRQAAKDVKKAKGGMTKGQKKIRTVMREFKAKKLKSSSGQKVTNPKQAIAIALSEAGQSKKMKKAKGGSFITKGGDYIKDLL